MLDEAEWAMVAPLLALANREAMAYAREHKVPLEEAMQRSSSALKEYNEMTGMEESNVLALWHHRAADYGPPCAQCGKPLRTPRARSCAACGAAA